MSRKFNFGVTIRETKKPLSKEEANNLLIKKFLRKWKKSGILRELKEKSYPITRGMKKRKKKYMGKRRLPPKNKN